MDFDFTEDQLSLRDAVARWVEKGFGFERRHALAKAGGKTRAVYAELAELGLTGLAIAPEHGGMGFGPIEAMVVTSTFRIPDACDPRTSEIDASLYARCE